MIKRDYKQISQYKIVDVYLKILSKHTRKKTLHNRTFFIEQGN